MHMADMLPNNASLSIPLSVLFVCFVVNVFF